MSRKEAETREDGEGSLWRGTNERIVAWVKWWGGDREDLVGQGIPGLKLKGLSGSP